VRGVDSKILLNLDPADVLVSGCSILEITSSSLSTELIVTFYVTRNKDVAGSPIKTRSHGVLVGGYNFLEITGSSLST